MALVSEDSLRDLFGHIVVGKTYSYRSKPYTVVSKLIYSAVFDGEREYWIEIEFQGPDGLCFLEFDYGSWTLSHHIGGFESGTSYEHDVLNRLKEGSPFRLLDSNYTVLEAAEAEVVFVQGAPSDQTTVGEHSFAAVDLFSCSPDLDWKLIAKNISSVLGAKNFTLRQEPRGQIGRPVTSPLQNDLVGV